MAQLKCLALNDTLNVTVVNQGIPPVAADSTLICEGSMNSYHRVVVSAIAPVLLFVMAVAAAHGQTFDVTIDSGASTVDFSISVNAPLQTVPTNSSHIIGNWDAATNPNGTRTIPGLVGGDPSANTPVPITSGGLSASGSTGSAPFHPAGRFCLRLEPALETAAVSGLAFDLLNGSNLTIGGTFSITYGLFRTVQPTCIIPGATIPIPVNALVTAAYATQESGPAVGALTQTGPDTYDFSVPVTLVVVVEAELNGDPLPADPQLAPVVLTGTVTVGGTSAAISSQIAIDDTQTSPDPQVLPSIPVTEPICGGNLLINLTIASITVHVTSDIDLSAGGPQRVPGDFNDSGTVDGDDVQGFVACLYSGGADCACVDPDGSGVVDDADLGPFVQLLLGAF